MKTAEETLKSELSEYWWDHINSNLTFTGDKLLKDWIVEAMKEYASQQTNENKPPIKNSLISTCPDCRAYNKTSNEELTKCWNCENSYKVSRPPSSPESKLPTDEEIVAYEWHNLETGHCYVDYIPNKGMGEEDGYTKTPLYKKNS